MQIKSLLMAGIVLMGVGMSAHALSVTPGRTEARLTPGNSIKTYLTVSNDTKEKVQIQMATKDWFVLDVNKKIPVDQWLQLPGKKQFWLKPGKSRKIKVKLVCPQEGQGEFVGMVSFIYQGVEPSMVTPMISVSVYMAVVGTEKPSGEITELALRLWENKWQAAVVVKATGNVHLRPSGKISLSDDKGENVGTFLISEGDPAYPGQVRGYMPQIPADFKLKPGHYVAAVDLSSQDVKMIASRGLTVLENGDIKMDEVKK